MLSTDLLLTYKKIYFSIMYIKAYKQLKYPDTEECQINYDTRTHRLEYYVAI